MLGLLLLFFIGKAFFNLAQKHQRNRWLFGVLGIVVFYGASIIGGFIIGFIAAAAGNESLFELPDFLQGIIAMPIGLLATWFFHYMLRKNWDSNPKDKNPELLDSTDF